MKASGRRAFSGVKIPKPPSVQRISSPPAWSQEKHNICSGENMSSARIRENHLRDSCPASSRTHCRQTEACDEYSTPDSASFDEEVLPGTIRYLSENIISFKVPDGASRQYEKLRNIGGFLVFDDAKGLQVWQRTDTKVAPEPVGVRDKEKEAQHLLPPTFAEAKMRAFVNLPFAVKEVLDHEDCPDDLSLKRLAILSKYRHRIEKARHKKWKKYFVAAKAMQKINQVRRKLRSQYDDELEAYRKKVQQKIRKDTLTRMKDLIAITVKVEKFDEVLKKCFQTEWSEFEKDL